MEFKLEIAKKKKTISWGQLLILLLLCRVFTLMTFVPLVANGYTPTTQILAAVFSIAFQAVIIIPLVILGHKFPNKSITELIIEKNRFLGIITSILYFAFFIFYSTNAVIHFERFITARFFPTSGEYIWAGIFLAVCAYCASLGIEGLSRSAVLIFLVFIVSIIIISITSAPYFDTTNYYYDESYKDNLLYAVLDDLARNGEIIALAFLCKYINKKFKCSSYGLLASKLIVSLIASFLIILVLGEFTALTDYPLLSVSSYAGIRFLQRIDSIFMVLWTITSVIAVSLFIRIAGGLTREIFPKMKLQNAVSAAIIFCIALPFIMTGSDFSGFYQYTCSGYAIILLTGVVPLLTLSTIIITSKIHKRNGFNNEK